jgi:hypothetical protein
MPFIVELIAFDLSSDWKYKLLSLVILFSGWYILISAGLNFNNMADDLIVLVILISFLVFFANYVFDFIRYANWLSTTTAVVSLSIIFATIWGLVKQVRYRMLQR